MTKSKKTSGQRKTVKAWAVVDKKGKLVTANFTYPFIYIIYQFQESSLVGEVVPVTLTYQLPKRK